MHANLEEYVCILSLVSEAAAAIVNATCNTYWFVVLNKSMSLPIGLLQRDDEGESVPKDPSGMDILHKDWEKAYDEQKRREELQAIARGEEFEGVAGDRTDKDVKDYKPDPFYQEFNESNDAAPANDTVPEEECAKKTVGKEATRQETTEDEYTDEEATDEETTEEETTEEESTDETTTCTDSDSEVDTDDVQPIPRTRQAKFSEDDDTSDMSTWERHAKIDSDETAESDLNDSDREERKKEKKKAESTFQRKKGKAEKKNEEKKAAGLPTQPMSLDELDKDQLLYTRDGIRQFLVKKPEEAAEDDVEEVKKIDNIKDNVIGHQPADSMTAGTRARIISTPPPDAENVSPDDPRFELIRLQHQTIGSLQATIRMLTSRQEWYDKRVEKLYIDKELDKKTMQDRATYIINKYRARQTTSTTTAPTSSTTTAQTTCTRTAQTTTTTTTQTTCTKTAQTTTTTTTQTTCTRTSQTTGTTTAPRASIPIPVSTANFTPRFVSALRLQARPAG